MLKRIIAAIIGRFVAGAVVPDKFRVRSAATNWNPGLPVGARAPAFKLVGQDGQEHDLAALLVKGKLALVFQRSADW